MVDIDTVIIPVKGVGGIPVTHAVGGEVRADDCAVIGIAACIIGVAREWIMGNEAFRDVPFLLEVPGFASLYEKAKGPDRKHIDILKNILQSLGVPA